MKIIGIAGGSGSGKTTFARLLMERLGSTDVSFLSQDNYYFDQSAKFDGDGGSVNFDHPESLDWQLMFKHIQLLKSGKSIEMPTYDFATHKRTTNLVKVESKPYVVIDGILIFVPENIWPEIDYRIFIRTNETLRFTRRLKRDTLERGRSENGVRTQYFSQVKPMHDRFVDPSSKRASEIISGEVDFTPGIQALVEKIKQVKT